MCKFSGPDKLVVINDPHKDSKFLNGSHDSKGQENKVFATVKPVLSGHIKIDKTTVLKTNGSLMTV